MYEKNGRLISSRFQASYKFELKAGVLQFNDGFYFYPWIPLTFLIAWKYPYYYLALNLLIWKFRIWNYRRMGWHCNFGRKRTDGERFERKLQLMWGTSRTWT